MWGSCVEDLLLTIWEDRGVGNWSQRTRWKEAGVIEDAYDRIVMRTS